MLNIYYGRENVNKEDFLIDKIKESLDEVILISPDQFTLEMEKLLLNALGSKAIFGVEILSFNRLGDKVLNEVGGSRKTVIDKYGRHMLLTKIALNKKDELEVYKGQERKPKFIDMVNNFISEIKRSGITPDDLENYITYLDKNSYTRNKLKAINIIYREYEKTLGDKYFDTEKKVDEYTKKIPYSHSLKGKTIWIYGFDSLAPKEIKIITELLKICNVNIILTYDKNSDEDIFYLSRLVIDNLSKIEGATLKENEIPFKYLIKKEKGISELEKNLFKFESNKKQEGNGVRVIEASNISNEAEIVSMVVLDLIKNKKLKMSDIRVICNDTTERVPMLKRMFNEYGLNLFSDEKVSIIDTNIVQYVLLQLMIVESGYNTNLIIKMLKTGFSDLTDDEILDLENYTYIYKIKGNMWKKDFTLFNDEDLDRINTLRKKAISKIELLEDITKEKTISSFIDKYLEFLVNDLEGNDNKIEKAISNLESLKRNDLAELNNQTIDEVKNILRQIKDILKDLEFNKEFLLKDFIDIFRVGISAIEIGLLPPTCDGIVLGTALRSRFTPKKAVIVYGANEGIFPEGKYDSIILSNEERKSFNEFYKEKELENKEDKTYILKGIEIKSKEIARLEENMGIYRTLSRANENLIFTYSLGNISGEKINPSETIKKVLQILDIKKEEDLVEKDSELLLANTCSGRRHLIEKLKEKDENMLYEIDPSWEKYISYLKKEDKDFLNTILNDMKDKNIPSPIGEKKAKDLYFDKEYRVSPSSIESYTRCPFRYFIDYGIRPKERRVFEVDKRKSGEIYHKVFEEILKNLVDNKGNIKGTNKPLEKENLVEFLNNFFNSNEFMLEFPEIKNMEGFSYIKERIREIALESSWALIKHIRKGGIKEFHLEENFKEEGLLKPIKVNLSNGEKGYIVGKIDRYDILDDNSIKIIDYKTGKDTISKEELESGYKLQLYLYYKAVKENKSKDDGYELAGLFYYHIWEPSLYDKDINDYDLDSEISKTYKMNGLFIDNLVSLNLIDCNPNILPQVSDYKLTEENTFYDKVENHMYSKNEFLDIETKVNEIILSNFNNLVSGKIDIHPMKNVSGSHCDYCSYKNICRFDERVFMNEYNRDVLKKKKEYSKKKTKKANSLTET